MSGEGDPDGDLSEVTMKLSARARKERRASIPTLRVVAGHDLLSFCALNPGQEAIVGRDETADLRLSDASVSRQHARFVADEDGTVTVFDQGSTNGTAINGVPITRALLRPGDHIEVGAVSLRLDLLNGDELAHLERVLERLRKADQDPLTGLYTRLFLDEELPRLQERCRLSETPLTLVFCDVDRFKSINDTWGHAVGDEVLRGTARLLLLNVRDSDAVMRYGGEEISIFLAGSDTIGGVEVAERMRRAIAGQDWGRTAPGLRVTASFGVTQWRPGEEDAQWFERADRAMYSAKSSGRNRVARAD